MRGLTLGSLKQQSTHRNRAVAYRSPVEGAMTPGDRKQYLASVVDRYVRGSMDRRSVLCAAGQLGMGAGALSLVQNLPFGSRGGVSSPAAAPGGGGEGGKEGPVERVW